VRLTEQYLLKRRARGAWGPIIEFMREMVEMALTWKDHSLGMLCDLVERSRPILVRRPS
jgi:hypothetical protein